jgi:autophagy-related protein 13
MAAHTAYRLGIIHFRTLFAFTRLLPSYRLHRKLRRSNSGLRVAMKVWAPEGYSNDAEDMIAAWEVMERGLVPLNHSLDQFVLTESTSPDISETHKIPPVDLFGSTYTLDVDYRADVDFSVEDMESVLSEKFVDMDEDWFTPTVARHRMEGEGKSAEEDRSIRRASGPAAVTATSPIPQRQQAAAPGSFGSLGTGSRPSASRVVSGAAGSTRVGSSNFGRWGILAEGLPFAGPTGPSETKVRNMIFSS